jgi:hypothetical protein
MRRFRADQQAVQLLLEEPWQHDDATLEKDTLQTPSVQNETISRMIEATSCQRNFVSPNVSSNYLNRSEL